MTTTHDDKARELLPCPFCGGDAQTDFIDGGTCRIECYRCDCHTAHLDTPDQAIAAWNRRAALSPASSTGQEAVGWIDDFGHIQFRHGVDLRIGTELYAAPAQQAEEEVSTPSTHAADMSKNGAEIDTLSDLERQTTKLQAALQGKQAEIDRLMLEYCPDEMTAEQKAEWARHQRPCRLK